MEILQLITQSISKVTTMLYYTETPIPDLNWLNVIFGLVVLSILINAVKAFMNVPNDKSTKRVREKVGK